MHDETCTHRMSHGGSSYVIFEGLCICLNIKNALSPNAPKKLTVSKKIFQKKVKYMDVIYSI